VTLAFHKGKERVVSIPPRYIVVHLAHRPQYLPL
jgi:hypothetical protein